MKIRLYLSLAFAILDMSATHVAGALSDVDVQKIASNYAATDLSSIDQTESDLDNYALASIDQDRKAYAIIVETLLELNFAADTVKSKQILAKISGQTLNPWQNYYLQMADVKIAALEKRIPDALNGVNWLLDNITYVTTNLANPFCAALSNGIQDGQGSFIPELLYAKAKFLGDLGRIAESKTVYLQIISAYPSTEWAKKAKTKL